MSIITIGIDLAKNVFAVHGVNEHGKAELVRPKVPRDQLLPLIANLPPCLIGMEACTGAHHWARLFRQYGHTVKLIAPKFVAPYRMTGKRGKNDAADAAAICEAVTSPQMRFVPVKDEHKQAALTLHRTRQGFVEERTALYNRIRGLIAEFGIVLPQKVERLQRDAAQIRQWLNDHPEDRKGSKGTTRKSNRTDNESAKMATSKDVIQGYTGVAAVAHKLARLIYTMLTKGEEYTDQGQDYYEERYRERVLRQLALRAEKIGMKLVVNEQPA